MRRRREQQDDPMPARLLHFDPADWPDACHPECGFWTAREAWRAEHPARSGAPLEPVDGPDVPLH